MFRTALRNASNTAGRALSTVSAAQQQQNNSARDNVVFAAGIFATTVLAAGSLSPSVSHCEGEHDKLDLALAQLHRIESSLRTQTHRLKERFTNGSVDVIVGSQWGDEGKGKLTDIVSKDYAICARVAGGSNAGHTIVVDDKKYKFHLIPSAILHPSVTCVIGNGVVVHLRGLLRELATLEEQGVSYENRLWISDRAHIVFDFHQAIDGHNEKALSQRGAHIGTTLKGIGPAYSSKTMRNGLRVGDLRDMAYFEQRLRLLAAQQMRAYKDLTIDVEAEIAYYREIRDKLLPLIADTVSLCQNTLKDGKNILVEGANATMLDLDFGTYPYVTSSNPSVGSTFTGLGVPPKALHKVTAIVKAYCTRVGEGPFPTELSGKLETELREKGHEYGTTTGRPRRCGWVDVPQLKYSTAINGFDEINLTKLDVLTGFSELCIGVRYVNAKGETVERMPASLSEYATVSVEYETLPGWTEDISKCRSFSELPLNCQKYVERLESLVDVPIRYIGVGPARDDIIVR